MWEKENFMVYSTLGDMSYFSYTKNIKISRAKSTTIRFILCKKLQKYLWMWKSKDKCSIYDIIRAFTENINNSRKVFGKHHNLEFAEFELRRFIGAILNHPSMIDFFAEIVVKCEVKPDEYIYIQQTPGYSNRHLFELPAYSNRFSFPVDIP